MAREPESKDRQDELFVPIGVRRRHVLPDVDLAPSRFFPPPTATTPDGLLAIGGRLAPEWLLDAYSHGIFPWPFAPCEPIVWWSPDPRAILPLDRLHVSRRLARTMRSGKFTVSCNRNFSGVIRGCATAGGREGETWLTPDMIAAYNSMHELGHAHSIEVWQNETLVGGTYGVAIGALFAAESMFHFVSDASKVAIVCLAEHLRARGYQLFDVQQWTPHTGRMGAREISRIDYLRRLAKATSLPVTFGSHLEGLALPNR